MKKLSKILLIIFFPLGILFCIGKCLFSGGFANFLGAVFLFLIGAGLAIYFLRYDLVEPIVSTIRNIFV